MRDTTRIGVVANAADGLAAAERDARLQRELADLLSIGLDPVDVDLRRYFGRADMLLSELQGFDALWVLGGDVIALRTAFGASGADKLIKGRLQDDSLVYAGYSAGACILGPRDALAVASYAGRLPGYPDAPVTTGMGLLPFAIVPHYPRHRRSSGTDDLTDHYIGKHVPFVALHDGQALVVDGEEQRVVE